MSRRPEENRQTRVDLVLLAVLALLVAGVGGMLLGGAVSSLITGGGWAWPPLREVPATLWGVVRHPGDPALGYPADVRSQIPGPVTYWIVVASLIGAVLIVATIGFIAALTRRTPTGMLTRAEARQLMKTLSSPMSPFAVYRSVPLRHRSEDAALVIGPQQMGKTTRVAVGRVRDAPGACLTTSTKADVAELTYYLRHAPDEDRHAYIFDLDDVTGHPSTVKWDLVAGCEDPKEAITRAAAMVKGRPISGQGSSNIGFFEGKATTVLRCYLHAAALDGRSAREVLAWSKNPSSAVPLMILNQHPAAAEGWAGTLEQETTGAAAETIASTFLTLGLTLECLELPETLELVCPAPGEGFDVDGFVSRNRDTLYVLSEGAGAASTGPLSSAFTAVVIEAARRQGRRRKISPPITLVLDELANIAAVPDIDKLLTDGGGRGISTWAIAQAPAQFVARWGRETFDILWTGTSLKLLLPGLRGDLIQGASRDIGDYVIRDVTHNRPGLFSNSGGSQSDQIRTERILPPEDITHMEDGKALLLWKNAREAVVDLPGWWERPDAKAFEAARERFRVDQDEHSADAELLDHAVREWRGRGATVLVGSTTGYVPASTVVTADGEVIPEDPSLAAEYDGVALLVRVERWETTGEDGEVMTARQAVATPVVTDLDGYGYQRADHERVATGA